ncbi:putative Mg2+ transporter-C (MgtC) family protein [Streptacidiphilus sp. MAP12-16]|jgi:putative Mg2+ transporter-C (MgtC) family protein|uniref:MgtC/SapB family protein n=1 Tax=Streptacidiphilus sp. MAP12-16 TaxID=3156300 RepID=UPI00351437DF
MTWAAAGITEPFGQGWAQLAQLGIAFVLSGIVGLEREVRQKAAGLRTYTVVGVGAALFVLVSKYGFLDMVQYGPAVRINPAVMAAQIVSGVGFIGAGVIFVQRSSVRGLTTAASIWLVAAIGSAAGAGLPVLASMATAGYLLITLVLRPVAHRLPVMRAVSYTFRITYVQRIGMLRELVLTCLNAGFVLSELASLTGDHGGSSADGKHGEEHTAEVSLGVEGSGDQQLLMAQLSRLPGVLACRRTDHSDE